MSENEQTPAARRERSAPAVTNEAVLARRVSNDYVTGLWVIAGVLVLAAIILYWSTFAVGMDDDAQALLTSGRTLELANTALIGSVIALVGGLVVSGLRWRPGR